MTTTHQVIWWGLLGVGLVGSALWSGVETGVYNVNRVRLHLHEHQGRSTARLLSRMLASPMPLLGTLLIANNICNYLGTSALTVLLESRGYTDLQVVAINVVLITPILFLFGETLPKDIFAVHSDRLTYYFVRPLQVMRWLFTITLVLPLILLFTRLTMRVIGMATQPTQLHPRMLVGHLMKEGVGYGVVSDEQSAIVERVLSLSSRTVRDEMVAWASVRTVSHDADFDALWDLANRTSNTRFPIVEADGSVQRIVSVMHVLRHQREQFPGLDAVATAAVQIDAGTPVRSALRTMQHSEAGLAIVVDEQRPVGIVTMKDLVEPITGELRGW